MCFSGCFVILITFVLFCSLVLLNLKVSHACIVEEIFDTAVVLQLLSVFLLGQMYSFQLHSDLFEVVNNTRQGLECNKFESFCAVLMLLLSLILSNWIDSLHSLRFSFTDFHPLLLGLYAQSSMAFVALIWVTTYSVSKKNYPRDVF